MWKPSDDIYSVKLKITEVITFLKLVIDYDLYSMIEHEGHYY